MMQRIDRYDGATCNVVSVLYIFQMRLKPCLATSYLLLLSIVSIYIAPALSSDILHRKVNAIMYTHTYTYARVDGNLH